MIASRKTVSRTSAKAIVALTAAGLLACSANAFASSHREAPNIAGNPRVDGTDLYAFNSYEAGRSAYTTIIANYNPGEDPGAGPNYYAFDPNAIYEIHIDNTGDGIEDITFRFKFSQALAGGNGLGLPVGTNPAVAIQLKNDGGISAGSNGNLNFIETYTVQMTTNDRNSNGTRKAGTTQSLSNSVTGTTFVKPFDYIGNKTFTNTAGYAAYANQFNYSNVTIPGCGTPGRVFVGQRTESFSVNLNQVFDLFNFGAGNVPVDKTGSSDPAEPAGGTDSASGIVKSRANDYLSGKNIDTIAMEIPTACLTGTIDANHNGVIGIWTTASLPQAQLLNPNATFPLPSANGGAYTQVSRLGMPLVNELVIGLKDKDHFNASKPINDTQFATYVTNPTLPALLNALFGVTAPTNFPRTDLEATFLTGLTGVNVMAAGPTHPAEMLRLNTTIPAIAANVQSKYGVLGGDTAGFPNGRRPGDEVVDITLRVAMGKLCTLSLGGCVAGDAPSGGLNYTDGAITDPVTYFDQTFPYLKAPIPGAP